MQNEITKIQILLHYMIFLRLFLANTQKQLQ